MVPRFDDTIAAPATPSGSGYRGIVRISGPAAKASLDSLFQPDDAPDWQNARGAARHAGALLLEPGALRLPVAVWLWPGQRSYTGEPLAEIHAPGSPPLLEAILDALFGRGVRPARPGEFTLRAFLAGRIDLTQAEAVLGVIDADDQQQLDRALQQLGGGVSRLLAPVRSDLLDLLADLEAGLDFVDEDIEFVSQEEILRRLRVAREAIAALLRQAGERMQSTGRRRVVLAGLPNAGKSTLFNALAGRAAALVSPAPGTTRDWLVSPLEWDGVPLDLVDTAGWEDTELEIGRLAQDLRTEQWDRADLVVWCTAQDLDENLRRLDSNLQSELNELGRPVVLVATKSDVVRERDDKGQHNVSPEAVAVSAPSGLGLQELRAEVASRLSSRGADGELLGSTAARCRDGLATAAESLERAESGVSAGVGDELLAIEIREALEHLGRILGAIYTDDILDRIFSRFCIGK